MIAHYIIIYTVLMGSYINTSVYQLPPMKLEICHKTVDLIKQLDDLYEEFTITNINCIKTE